MPLYPGNNSGTGSAVISTTVENLVAMKRSASLSSGSMYQTAEGYTYYARSASQLIPQSDRSPILALSTLSMGGDSIFANGFSSGQGNSLSIPNWAASHMPYHFDLISNRGVGGQAIATVISSQQANLIADASEIVWLHCGVNNLRFGNATATSIDQAVVDANSLISALATVKQCVIFDAVNPETLAASDGYRSVEIPELNDRLAQVCARYPNVIFNDCYTTILDATSPIGDVDKTSTFDNSIHPNTKGAQLLGFQSAKNLRQRLIVFPFYVTQSTVALPNLSGTAGTLTPGSGSFGGGSVAPTGTTVSIAGTGNSVVTTSQKTYTSTAIGLNFVVTNASANPNFIGLATDTATTAALLSQFSAGDKVRFIAKIRVKSAVNLLRIASYLLVNGSIVSGNYQYNVGETPNNAVLGNQAYTVTQRSPVYTIPAGMTSIQPTISLQVGATTGAADFDLISWTIEKVA